MAGGGAAVERGNRKEKALETLRRAMISGAHDAEDYIYKWAPPVVGQRVRLLCSASVWNRKETETGVKPRWDTCSNGGGHENVPLCPGNSGKALG